MSPSEQVVTQKWSLFASKFVLYCLLYPRIQKSRCIPLWVVPGLLPFFGEESRTTCFSLGQIPPPCRLLFWGIVSGIKCPFSSSWVPESGKKTIRVVCLLSLHVLLVPWMVSVLLPRDLWVSRDPPQSGVSSPSAARDH